MFNRSNVSFSLFLFLSDLILTDVALHIAKVLRLTLLVGEPLPPAYIVFPLWLYILVPGIWAVVFLARSAFADL